jgi:acetoin utilization deacetylase AcuC-like enzyme
LSGSARTLPLRFPRERKLPAIDLPASRRSHGGVILATDPLCRKHDAGPQHPEQPRRYDAVLDAFRANRILDQCRMAEPRDVTLDDLLLVHSRSYLELAEKEIRAGSDQLSTGDTSVCPESWEAARRAAGCAMAAVDGVFQGDAKTAFCLIRPPGHHATPTRGMGFCILNNVALAARHAQRRDGVGRVAIVDWDVHHGNGTQDTFYSDGTVFFFSVHQSPWYPGTGAASETGEGEGKDATLNCPLPAGSGREEVLACFEKKLLPALLRFRPELVLISAGFDSREGDPLGQFRLSDRDFADLTGIAREIAEKSAQGRVVSVLEGGYNLAGLASAATAHVRALL